MSKAEISLSEVSPAQIAETLLVQYGLPVGFASPPPGSGESAPHIRQLYGGYSGSNYAVRLRSQNRAVCFKVCNGYAAEEVERPTDAASAGRHVHARRARRARRWRRRRRIGGSRACE